MTEKTATRAFLTLVAVSVTSGCAMKGDVRLLQEDIRQLAARQDSVLSEIRAQQAASQDTVIRSQSDQIVDFRGDINRSLRSLEEGIRRLEAIAGENQQAISGLRQQMATASPAPTPRQPFVGDTGDPSSERLVDGGGEDPEEVFGLAMDALGRESLLSATRGFLSFLESFPNHERAPDAHYFMGDILSQQGEPAEAIAAFEQVRILFPDHSRVADSLFRIGEEQVKLGETEAAIETFERVVNTYPGNILATLAQERIEELGG